MKSIFIGFFEEIRDNPRKLLLEIQEFLEVDSVITGDLEKVSLPKTTARRNKLLFNNDPELNHILKTSLKEDTISLSREFNNQYTQQWLVKLLDTD